MHINNYKINIKKWTEIVVKFVLPLTIVFNGLIYSFPKYKFKFIISNLLEFNVANFRLIAVFILYFSIFVFAIDTICFGRKKNPLVNRLISNLRIVCFHSMIGSFLLIFSDLIFNNQYYLNDSKNIFWVGLGNYSTLFEAVFGIITAIFIFWLSLFILRYFRVFSNNNLQNVLINKFIHNRGYKPKVKTVRQKIEDVKKIHAYNKTYNSNFNNFTKYDVNVATNKDFTFDYLEIQEYNNKTKLASFNKGNMNVATNEEK
jgi:hypothetical protein